MSVLHRIQHHQEFIRDRNPSGSAAFWAFVARNKSRHDAILTDSCEECKNYFTFCHKNILLTIGSGFGRIRDRVRILRESDSVTALQMNNESSNGPGVNSRFALGSSPVLCRRFSAPGSLEDLLM